MQPTSWGYEMAVVNLEVGIGNYPGLFFAMHLTLPCSGLKVDSLITGTGLQYAEAGVEARELVPSQ